METTTESAALKAVPMRPNIFDFLDYRGYLRDSYAYRKATNPRFSENAFALAAGFGKNSRGYLGLVVKGKRNLTAKSIVGFSQALGLNAREALFFENMVHFCQSESEKERVYFFERLKIAAQGENSRPIALLDSHLRFLNEWHLVVLREMVNLADFKEESAWVSRRLSGRITHDKVLEGFNDLLALGLLRRENGKLVQSDPVMIFKDDKNNFKNSALLHRDFAARASEAMVGQDYEKRAAQLITLTVPKKRFEDLRREMRDITETLLKKYGSNTTDNAPEHIVQMGIQLLQVTV
jgi:uncharacterized protein (TIGR02147 family)